jgi:hypothetical protein
VSDILVVRIYPRSVEVLIQKTGQGRQQLRVYEDANRAQLSEIFASTWHLLTGGEVIRETPDLD